MNSGFTTGVYEDAKRLFPPGAVQARVVPPKIFERPDPAVRLVHASTGISVTCDQYESQTENFIAAAIRLRIVCDERRI